MLLFFERARFGGDVRVSGDEAKTDPRRRFGLETEQRGEKDMY